MLNILYT